MVGQAGTREAGGQATSDGEWLSPSFGLDEFACQDGTPVPAVSHAALSELCREYLEPLRARFGAAIVHSGYRTEAHNEHAGGIAGSYHVYELHPGCAAADVEFANGVPAEWAQHAEELGAGGVGRYDSMRFLHVDTRAEKCTWHQS